MREIKFRAWDKVKSEMIFNSMEYHLRLIEHHCDITQADDIYYIGFSKFDYERFDLMQYTGLKDKNGKEIYEGDVVKIIDISSRKKPFIAEVYFDLNVASFSGKVKDYPVELFLHNPIKKEYFINEMQKYIFEDRTIEVIGNIYENPELCK